jgi:hypothetical protein
MTVPDVDRVIGDIGLKERADFGQGSSSRGRAAPSAKGQTVWHTALVLLK